MNADANPSPEPPDTSSPSALDVPIAVTFFENFGAKKKTELQHSLRSLADAIRRISKPDKKWLPWLKLARFGDQRSDKNSLRHDANVLAVTGLEADYDGEQMAFEAAVEIATKANLLCIIYTSPSHTEDAPRWRVLCPFSEELPPDRREKMFGRINGLFGGIFSGESWTLSQAYYFGAVRQNPSHQVALIDGIPIDLLDDLDRIWRGKPDTNGRTGGAAQGSRSGSIDEAALLQQIISGKGYHSACMRLLGSWALAGVSLMEARARLIAAFEQMSQADRDARWRQRYGDIDRCLTYVYIKDAATRDAGQRQESHASGAAPQATDAEPWPDPLDFLAESDLTGVPQLSSEHVPEPIYAFACDTAERMGVDPVSVAVSAIVSCASVMDETWQMQPKQHDTMWVEAARLWGVIVGDPSILKSPVLAACTRPIDRLDVQARETYADAFRVYRHKHKAWEKAGGDLESEPRRPRMDRHLVEGTTIEALSEVLRDDQDAKFKVPSGRILIRQDEMSEWVASFDR